MNVALQVDFVPKPFSQKGVCRPCCENLTHSAIHSGRLEASQ